MSIEYRLMTADALRIGDTLRMQGRDILVKGLLWHDTIVTVNGSFDFEDCDVVRISA